MHMKSTYTLSLLLFTGTFLFLHRHILANEDVGDKELDLSNLDGFNVQDISDAGDAAEGKEEEKVSEEELLDSSEDPMLLSESDMDGKGESHEYQAEVSRLLDIIVNSLYTTKEVFLRELVSNSADALEKYKILAYKNKYDDLDAELFVKIRVYPKKRVLTIHDNGIGMTWNDLKNNLGTIAKSGTANFLDMLSKGDSNLIGQFGVGFYSAFLVADSVVVQSRYPGDKQYVWKSSADNSYELYEDPKGETLGDHGTLVTLHLKEDATDYLKNSKLETLVKRYSQFIRFPIYLYKLENKEMVWKHLNDVPQIWTRDKTTITKEEYNDFYKVLSGDYDKPLTHIHFSAEGDVEFKALLYIPSKPPNPYFDTSNGHNVKLYSRRVLISESLPDLVPRYLFSLYGVVDSDSFPLNVSRENLQQSKLVKIITKKITRTVLDTLYDLMINSKDDEDKTFDKFYQAFRGSLKVGCYEDFQNRKRIAKILKYKTSKHKDVEITLDEYISEMKSDQNVIYYASGDSYNEIHSSPHLQGFIKRDYDVLYLTDTLDESCISQLFEYEGKTFKSVQKGEVVFELTQEEKELEKKKLEKYKPFITTFKKHVPEVMDIKISRRLVVDPCIVVASDWGMSAQMEKLMKSYVVNKQESEIDIMTGMKSRLLEINPDHPIMIELLKRSIDDPESEELKSSMVLLYNTAKLASGFAVEDTNEIVKSTYSHMSSLLNVDENLTLDSLTTEESVGNDEL